MLEHALRFQQRGNTPTVALEVRRFINSWWHSHDTVSAAESLDTALAELGLAAVSVALLEGVLAVIPDEDDARRHQIGIAARHANAQLAQLGRAERVRAFREDSEWSEEDDEPLWLVVDPDEHAHLLAEIGPPEDLEAEYDDPASHPEPLTRPPRVGPRMPRSTAELELFAHEQVRAQNYPLALEAIDRLRTSGDPGVLIELMWISTLHSAGRRDDAITAWHTTADAWLAGERAVWRSQWVTLEKLHVALRLPEGPELVQIRARQKTAPE